MGVYQRGFFIKVLSAFNTKTEKNVKHFCATPILSIMGHKYNSFIEISILLTGLYRYTFASCVHVTLTRK